MQPSKLHNPKGILQDLTERLEEHARASVRMSAELEFYLKDPAHMDDVISICNRMHVVPEVTKEKGKNQCEIQCSIPSTPLVLAEYVTQIRHTLQELLKDKVTFEPKPFENDYGNAIHFHLSLHDKNGASCFDKMNEEENPLLLQATAGLCKFLPDSMACFAPTESCYQRFVPNFFAPCNVSWGGNNRTVAIRIPDPRQSGTRRIEHRVSSSLANPYDAIAAILAATDAGIDNQLSPPAKMYGDAGHKQYNLPPLPSSLDEANALMERSRWCMEYRLGHA